MDETDGAPAKPAFFAVQLVGETACCDWRGAAYFPAHRLLVLSDLHLEKGSSFARRGSFMPPYDTHETLARAAAVIEDYHPAVVICLGDSFHDDDGHGRITADVRERITGLSRGREWCWISGNHDPSAPEDLPGFAADELAVGNLVFRHQPLSGRADGEVSGHLHPAARIVRRGRSVRRDCFAVDGSRMMLPAFGAYTGSLNVLAPAYRDLFDWRCFQALLLGDRRIYPIGAAHLVPDRSCFRDAEARRRA